MEPQFVPPSPFFPFAPIPGAAPAAALVAGATAEEQANLDNYYSQISVNQPRRNVKSLYEDSVLKTSAVMADETSN